MTNLLQFSVAERDRRWSLVREAMGSASIDVLVAIPDSSPVDALYLGGEPGAVILPLDGAPMIILGGEDSHLAVDRPGWIDDRTSATPYGSSRVPFGQIVGEVLARRFPHGRIALAGLGGSRYSHVRAAEGYVPAQTAERIARAVGADRLVDGSAIVEGVRRVKSEAELDVLRASARHGEQALVAIGDAFEPGATQRDAFAAGVAALCHPDIVSPMLAWCPGPWGQPRRRFVAAPPGRIDPGLCVATEVFAGIGPYVAQVAHPFVAGELSAEQVEAFEFSLRSFAALRAALRAGTTWREVKAATCAAADGTPWAVSFVLHSGLDGPLFIPADDNEECLDDVVPAGSVYIAKPHVYPRQLGRSTARSHDMAWGDTVVVGSVGAERLGTRPLTYAL